MNINRLWLNLVWYLLLTGQEAEAMFIDKLLFSGKMESFLEKGLTLSANRHLLIAGNIGNADTPNYKATDMDFSQHMEEELGKGSSISMQTTSKKHINPTADGSIVPDVFEQAGAARSNGNNVNMDKEMASMAENQLMYTMIAQLITKQESTTKSAITESALQ
jgi:flagellar basal-body rod protein FlgB